MANLTLSQTWEANIYQLEQTDPVVGGTPVVGSPTKQGVDNWQAQQLGNRTQFLKPHIDMIRQIMILEGETISTANTRQLYDTILGMIAANASNTLPRDYLYTARAMKQDSASVVSFPAEIACVDSTNTHEIVIPANTTASLATDLDTGTLAVDTWYHPYAIKNTVSNAVDVIFSVNTTNPTLPSGFTVYRKLPFPIRTKTTTTDILKFQMVRTSGMTRCRFLEDPIVSGTISDLELFTNIGSTPLLVNFGKVIPNGESGATCTASLLVYGVGDTNNNTATLLEKSTDDQMAWRSFGTFIGNDNATSEVAAEEFFLRPTGRNCHIRQISGVLTSNRGRGTGYNLYR
jgi:hypothetical protein